MQFRVTLFLSSILSVLLSSTILSQAQSTAQTSGEGILDQGTTYYCDESSFSNPTLVFRSDLGNARLIEFRTKDFGQQWTPEDRCRTIADRAQDFHKLRIIAFLTLEEMPPNGTRAICISKIDADHIDLLNLGEDLNLVRLLMTLKPDDDPDEILDEIRGLSSLSSDGEPLIH